MALKAKRKVATMAAPSNPNADLDAAQAGIDNARRMLAATEAQRQVILTLGGSRASYYYSDTREVAQRLAADELAAANAHAEVLLIQIEVSTAALDEQQRALDAEKARRGVV